MCFLYYSIEENVSYNYISTFDIVAIHMYIAITKYEVCFLYYIAQNVPHNVMT